MGIEQRLEQILERVTGRPASTGGIYSLSSVQQGVVSSLCRKEGIAIDAAYLSRAFSIRELSGQAGAAGGAGNPGVAVAALPSMPARPVGEGVAIGCDIQNLGEFETAILSRDFKECPFLTAHLSQTEISYCEGQKDPLSSLCGVFAAKEAVFKAGRNVPLSQIAISHVDGAPRTAGFAVSISHSRDYCMAVAVQVSAATTPSTVAEAGPETRPPQPRGARPFRMAFVLAYNAAIVVALGWLLARAVQVV